MPIRLKLSVLFLVICLIPSLFISVLTFTDYKNSLEANRVSALRDIISFKADKMESVFATLKNNIEMAQYFWNIKKNLPTLTRLAHNTNSPEFAAAKNTLDGQLRPMQKFLDLDDIMLLNPEGKIVYSSNEKQVQDEFLNPLPDPNQEAFLEGKSKVYFTDLYASKAKKEEPTNMFISAPTLDSEGAFIGVIVFDVNMIPVYKLIQETAGLGNTGETLIVKKNGDKVIYLNRLRYAPGAALTKTITFGKSIGLPAQEAAKGESGSGILTDYRGKEVIAAWRYMPSLGWGIVGKIDTREAFADVENLKNLVLIILAIVFFLVGIMAFSIGKSISDPINMLAKGAEIIGKGNLDYKVRTEASDEIGQLSRAFDRMTGDLKHTTTSIDRLKEEIDLRRKTEESVRRLAAIVESSEDAIIGKDLDNTIKTWNKGAEHLYGYGEKEVIGKHISLIATDKYSDELPDILQKIKDGQKVEHYETMRRRKDGTLVDVSLSMSPIKDSTGNIIGVSTIAHDITERRKLKELLKKYNAELAKEVEEKTRALRESQESLIRAEKLAIVGKLAASVAHELRNPLGVMKNVVYYLNMLELYKDNPDFKENLDIIAVEIERSDKIIADLLDFSRTKKPVFRPENINLIIKEILNRLKTPSGVEIVLELGTSLPEVEVDALQMHQVFYNLAKNAVEAMEKGGVLRIRTAVKNDSMEISFSDTGSGIKKENLAKVCEPLFSTKAKGTGLGLSVCSSLVEGHNGRIEIESEPDKGSIFMVKLPLKKSV